MRSSVCMYVLPSPYPCRCTCHHTCLYTCSRRTSAVPSATSNTDVAGADPTFLKKDPGACRRRTPWGCADLDLKMRRIERAPMPPFGALRPTPSAFAGRRASGKKKKSPLGPHAAEAGVAVHIHRHHEQQRHQRAERGVLFCNIVERTDGRRRGPVPI